MSAVSISKRIRLRIKGIVQGVGMRPYLYRQALLHTLGGFVYNDADGVILELEGDSKNIELFCDELTLKAPPLCRIDSYTHQELALSGAKEFVILHSQSLNTAHTMLSPDISLCDACRAEMQDPKNRRFGYAFTNCTDCGPRYTIMQTLPYDRPNTSMHTFTMCKECRAEYENPLDRRYHAQPISCAKCGPTLYLLDSSSNKIAQNSEAIRLTCKHIKEGKIVAIKGLGGFHILCDATNDEALQLLRKRKKREYKPFAVMFCDMKSLKYHTDLTPFEEKLITSKERPIVVVQRRPDSFISLHVTPHIDKIGVFLPYTPLHYLLLQELRTPIVATSANISEEPIIIDENELLLKLGDVVDFVLTHDRDIVNGCDDSVAFMADDVPIMLRCARGFAPLSLPHQKRSSKNILALGANQKNAIALAFENNLILSPHIGDLNSLESFEYFKRTLKSFEGFYGFKPDIIVCDKHPHYMSSQFAREYKKNNPDVTLLEIQHHYAHTLACMAEFSLDEKVLAFCFDGTGYGDDQTIWGGEVFVADTKSYERVYYLKPFSLLGGEKAIKEPKRVALALLFEQFCLEEILSLDLPTIDAFSQQEIRSLHVMWQKSLNSPKTSSFGRVFDMGLLQLVECAKSLVLRGKAGFGWSLWPMSVASHSHTHSIPRL